MGGMHTWIWGVKYPDFMDALVPLASQPTEMSSRNCEAVPVIHRISELKPCEESLPTVILAFGTPVRTATPHVDQNKVPNNLLVNEPSLSTQGIGGSSGR